MTIKEHLENLREVMLRNRAQEVQILYCQLYLLCCANHGMFEYIENPFLYLDKVLDIWDKAIVTDGNHVRDLRKAFLHDDDIKALVGTGEFRKEFRQRLSNASRSGRFAFDHLQPPELTELVYRLSQYHNGKTVYNPFAGVGSYATYFNAGDLFFGEEIDSYVWGIGSLRMWMDGCPSSHYVIGDSLNSDFIVTDPNVLFRNEDVPTGYDVVISTPPFGWIDGSKEKFAENLISRADSLLNEDGVMVVVCPMSTIITSARSSLLESGMLDAVITLPGQIFYWSGVPAAVIRLAKNKLRINRERKEVRLVDGTSLFKPGVKGKNVIDVDRIIKLMKGGSHEDPNYVIHVPDVDIIKNDFRLIPAVYLTKEETVAGENMVPLKDLGRFNRIGIANANPSRCIMIKDLTAEPDEVGLVAPSPYDGKEPIKLVMKPCFLIGGRPDKLRFGYVENCSPDNPLYVSYRIKVFYPDEKLINWQYLAHALSKAQIGNTGTSVLVITTADLEITRIPLIPLEEQTKFAKKLTLSIVDNEPSIIQNTARAKVNVALVGFKELLDPDGRLYVRARFDSARQAMEWIPEHRSDIDAILLEQTDTVSPVDVLILCSREVPVFMTSSNLATLETTFDSYAEKYLEGRCFEAGLTDDMLSALFAYVTDHNSPEGRIREQYSAQLDAASSLDKTFHYHNFVLRDVLEDLIVGLFFGTVQDPRNQMRKIRDNCILQVLSDYGFLPRRASRSFDYGAMPSLLADRYFKRQFILKKEVLPADLASLLRASTQFLNTGSHSFSEAESGLYIAVLHILMAVICHISDMVDNGQFDARNAAETRQMYVMDFSDDMATTGRYEVKALKDDESYLYAGNIHLNPDTCRDKNIRAGDVVNITRNPSSENEPKITDYYRILFYARDFEKVN